MRRPVQQFDPRTIDPRLLDNVYNPTTQAPPLENFDQDVEDAVASPLNASECSGDIDEGNASTSHDTTESETTDSILAQPNATLDEIPSVSRDERAAHTQHLWQAPYYGPTHVDPGVTRADGSGVSSSSLPHGFDLLSRDGGLGNVRTYDWPSTAPSDVPYWNEQSYHVPGVTTQTSALQAPNQLYVEPARSSTSTTITCPECQRAGQTITFNHLGDYNHHNRYHELPHQCSTCPKRFADTRDLKRHQDTHSKIKRFWCNVGMCGKGFARNDQLKRHKMDVHKWRQS